MSYFPLSKLIPLPPLSEVIQFLVSERLEGITNDLSPQPHIEYHINDLPHVWNNILFRYANHN